MGAAGAIALAPMRILRQTSCHPQYNHATLVGEPSSKSAEKCDDPHDPAKREWTIIMTGKIADLERHLRGGFAVGHFTGGLWGA